MSMPDRIVTDDVYKAVVILLKQIAKPKGAWNNDMKIYFKNVIKTCIKNAEIALDLLGEEYQSLESTVRSEE